MFGILLEHNTFHIFFMGTINYNNHYHTESILECSNDMHCKQTLACSNNNGVVPNNGTVTNGTCADPCNRYRTNLASCNYNQTCAVKNHVALCVGKFLKIYLENHHTIIVLHKRILKPMLMLILFSPHNNWLPEKQTIILNEQKRGHKERFIVTCQESCQDVKIKLHVESGDPELFALDGSQPRLSGSENCEACSSFCNSRHGATESCDISTDRNTFYVLIYALSDYGKGDITFENVLNVETYGKLL